MSDLVQNLLNILLNKNISINNLQVLENIFDINVNNYNLFIIISDESKIINFLKEEFIIFYKKKLDYNKTLLLFSKKNFDLSLMKPLISICIPTYYSNKKGDVLSYSIQEWSKSENINLNLVEFIIVENGSDYYNIEKLDKYNLKIKLLKLKEANLGKARKLSVENSNSEILLLVNDDTIPTYNLIEKHLFYQLVNYEKNIAILGKFLFHKNALNSQFMKIIDEYSKIFIQNKLEDNKEYKNYKLFITNNISIKKNLILEAGNFSEEFMSEGEDTDLGYRLLNNGLSIIFKSDIISYHLHEHDINSYLDLIRRRSIAGAKVSKKYSNSRINDFKNFVNSNITTYKIFVDYVIRNNIKDPFLGYYINSFSFCSHILSGIDVLDKIYNKKINLKLVYLNENSKIINLIHKENEKYLDVFKIKNYYLYDEQTHISDVFEEKFDYLNISEKYFMPLSYSNFLFLNVKNNIDKSFQILIGFGFSFDTEKKEIIPTKNIDIFLSKSLILSDIELIEYKIIDIKKILNKKNTFNLIPPPFTSIYVNK